MRPGVGEHRRDFGREPVSLLPESIADERCTALDACSQRLESLDIAVVLTLLIDVVDASALPHLAWQFHVENFDSSAPAADQRAAIRASVEEHRRRGTPWSIRRALELAGYQYIEIIESAFEAIYHDGTIQRDGQFYHDGGVGSWATYQIRVGTSTSGPPFDVGYIRRLLAPIQPVRCQLIDLNPYTLLHDGIVSRDGSETHDGAKN